MHACLLLALFSLRVSFPVDERLQKWETHFTPSQVRDNEALSLYGLGVLHAKQDRLLQALNALESAALLDTQSACIQRELASIYQSLNRSTHARIACTKVLRTDPQDYWTRYNLAKLLEADGQQTEAVASLQEALKSPRLKTAPERRYLLQSVLTVWLDRLGNGDAAIESEREVIALLDRYREQFQENAVFAEQRLNAIRAESYERLGKLLQQQKKYDEAKTAYRQAHNLYLELKEGDERTAALRFDWHLSDLAYLQGDWQNALVFLEHYTSYQPLETTPYARKAELLRKLDRSTEVLPMLEKEMSRPSSHPGLKILYARELGRTPGRAKEAERLLEEACIVSANAEPFHELFAMHLERDDAAGILDFLDRLSSLAFPEEDRYSPERARAERMLSLAGKAVDESASKKLVEQLSRDGKEGKPHEVYAFVLLGQSALSNRDWRGAETLLNIAREKGTSDKNLAESIVASLIDAYRMGRAWQKLADLTSNVIARKPSRNLDYLARWQRPYSLDRLGQHDEALRTLEESLGLIPSPDRFPFNVLKADLLSRADRFDYALAWLESLTTRSLTQSESFTVLLSKAKILRQAGKSAEAEPAIRLLLELYPDAREAKALLAGLLAEEGRSLDEAERLAREAAAEERQSKQPRGEDSQLLDTLAFVLFKEGKLAEAKAIQVRAIDAVKREPLPRDKEEGVLQEHLGDILRAMGETDAARKAYERAEQWFKADAWSKEHGKVEAIRKKF